MGHIKIPTMQQLHAAANSLDSMLRYCKGVGQYDIAVVGGGIIGSATARALKIRHPNLRVALIEKESGFGRHQTGNSSGVIHEGVYYKPSTLKARICVDGLNQTYKYLHDNNINHKKCGKLIVATKAAELPRLYDLYQRGLLNGVKDLRLLVGPEIQDVETNCKGIEALWSPHTGVVDWKKVTESYVKDFEANGGKTFLDFKVERFIDAADPNYPVLLMDSKKDGIHAKYVVTCCGLHSDTMAMKTGCHEEPRIVPFRGEYLQLVPRKSKLVKTNIYPVPDPRKPFLGVRITPTVDGRIIVGPNSVLPFCRNGIRWKDVKMKEMKEIMGFPGMRKLAARYAVFGLRMAKSAVTPMKVKHIQTLVNDLESEDVKKGPVRVRAQAIWKDGSLADALVLDVGPGPGTAGRVLHCRAAPSCACTASLAIADMIVDKINEELQYFLLPSFLLPVIPIISYSHVKCATFASLMKMCVKRKGIVCNYLSIVTLVMCIVVVAFQFVSQNTTHLTGLSLHGSCITLFVQLKQVEERYKIKIK